MRRLNRTFAYFGMFQLDTERTEPLYEDMILSLQSFEYVFYHF